MKSILEYLSFSDFLRDYAAEQKQRSSKFSYQFFAKKLGLKSASLIAMLVKGERLPTDDFLQRLMSYLRLSTHEIAYAETLLRYCKANDGPQKEYFAEKLKSFRRPSEVSEVRLDEFELIASWLHVAILELCNLKDFRGEIGWIAKRLGFGFDVKEVEEALLRLERLGLLVRDDSGVFSRTKKGFRTPDGVPSSAIRHFHAEVLDRAKAAITEQGVEERFLNAVTLSIQASQMEKARELIRNFMVEFSRAMQAEGTADETYQLALQFYKVSKEKTK